MDGWMHVFMHVYIYMYACMYEYIICFMYMCCIYVRIDSCMYLFMCAYMHIYEVCPKSIRPWAGKKSSVSGRLQYLIPFKVGPL
jgi:hypothetical protein